MATSTTQDQQDDLIILDDTDNFTEETPITSEDNTDTNPEIINLDDNDNSELINLDTDSSETKEEEQNNSSDEVITLDDSSDNLFDISNIDETTNNQETEKEETEEEDTDFSFDMTEDTQSGDYTATGTTNDTEEVFDLDAATNAFIDQLNKRKDQISTFVKKDEDSIVDLEEQVKKLKEQISEFNSKIKELKSEDTKIDDRITMLTGSKTTTKKAA